MLTIKPDMVVNNNYIKIHLFILFYKLSEHTNRKR